MIDLIHAEVRVPVYTPIHVHTRTDIIYPHMYTPIDIIHADIDVHVYTSMHVHTLTHITYIHVQTDISYIVIHIYM